MKDKISRPFQILTISALILSIQGCDDTKTIEIPVTDKITILTTEPTTPDQINNPTVTLPSTNVQGIILVYDDNTVRLYSPDGELNTDVCNETVCTIWKGDQKVTKNLTRDSSNNQCQQTDTGCIQQISAASLFTLAKKRVCRKKCGDGAGNRYSCNHVGGIAVGRYKTNGCPQTVNDGSVCDSNDPCP